MAIKFKKKNAEKRSYKKESEVLKVDFSLLKLRLKSFWKVLVTRKFRKYV